MHRFHLPPEDCRSDRLTIRGREAHHALHVLRLQPGDVVTVLDGAGGQFLCEVVETVSESLQLRVTTRRAIPPPACPITLAQALPKGRLLEDIIQKATELGVHRLVPLLSQRVVPHLDAAGAEARLARWRRTAIEAIKQSGNPWLPHIEAPQSPRDFLARAEPFDLTLLAALCPSRRHLRDHFRSFLERHQRPPRSVCVWVGPEGDFTPEEIALAEAAGALALDLGPRVLRCDTAALYCLATLNHELSAPFA